MLAVSPADLEERSRNLDAALEVNANCSVVYKAIKSIGLLKKKVQNYPDPVHSFCLVDRNVFGSGPSVSNPPAPHTRFNIH